MNKEELLQFIKDNLLLEIDQREYDTGKEIEISLHFDGEVISSGIFEVNTPHV